MSVFFYSNFVTKFCSFLNQIRIWEFLSGSGFRDYCPDKQDGEVSAEPRISEV